jgi:osmotically-inducible protein OsmY
MAALALAACTPASAVVGAGAAVGVAAAQERSLSEAASDTRIRLDINRLLLQERHDVYLDVHLQVVEGRVLLSGTVPDAQARVDAVRLTWQAKGVREVINEMQLADKDTLADFASDRWIETRIRTKLLADKEVHSVNFSIEAVDGAVFLMGIAQDQDEVERVVGHSKDVPRVRRLVNYIVLKDDPDRPS